MDGSKGFRSVTPDEAQHYVDTHPEGSYTLLDVRQDWEYEEFHLPGSRLIPLPDLTDRLDELDRTSTTLVYCAAGQRSLAAAGLLAGNGFVDIMNIRGGAMAWQGSTATGPETAGLLHLRGDESVEEVIRLAFRMESSLEDFYTDLAARPDLRSVSPILTRLAAFEAGHQQRLFGIYQSVNLAARDIAELERETAPGLLEGAVTAEEFMAEHPDFLQTPRSVVQTAMMLEAQAQDLYMRYSRKAEKEDTRLLLERLAGDEKAHLRELATVMDSRP